MAKLSKKEIKEIIKDRTQKYGKVNGAVEIISDKTGELFLASQKGKRLRYKSEFGTKFETFDDIKIYGDKYRVGIKKTGIISHYYIINEKGDLLFESLREDFGDTKEGGYFPIRDNKTDMYHLIRVSSDGIQHLPIEFTDYKHSNGYGLDSNFIIRNLSEDLEYYMPETDTTIQVPDETTSVISFVGEKTLYIKMKDQKYLYNFHTKNMYPIKDLRHKGNEIVVERSETEGCSFFDDETEMLEDIVHKDIKEINGLFLSTDIFGTKSLIKKSNDIQQVLLADIVTIEETKNDFYFCKILENKTESFAILTKDGRILKADLANSEIQVDQLLEHEKQITSYLINTSSKIDYLLYDKKEFLDTLLGTVTDCDGKQYFIDVNGDLHDCLNLDKYNHKSLRYVKKALLPGEREGALLLDTKGEIVKVVGNFDFVALDMIQDNDFENIETDFFKDKNLIMCLVHNETTYLQQQMEETKSMTSAQRKEVEKYCQERLQMIDKKISSEQQKIKEAAEKASFEEQEFTSSMTTLLDASSELTSKYFEAPERE